MYNSTSSYSMPSSSNYNMYKNNSNLGYYDERGFWIPFVVGGLAGGALGYGIANNNFLSNNPVPVPYGYPPPRPCCGRPPYMPYPYPY